jgi:hypothetical protein
MEKGNRVMRALQLQTFQSTSACVPEMKQLHLRIKAERARI